MPSARRRCRLWLCRRWAGPRVVHGKKASMVGEQFDWFARMWVHVTSRRHALSFPVGIGLAAVLSRVAGVEGMGACRKVGARCERSRNCCAGSRCKRGKCRCKPGWEDCGSDGLCDNLQSSSVDCGSCGHTCPSGMACQSGRCACSGGEDYCTNRPSCQNGGGPGCGCVKSTAGASVCIGYPGLCTTTTGCTDDATCVARHGADWVCVPVSPCGQCAAACFPLCPDPV